MFDSRDIERSLTYTVIKLKYCYCIVIFDCAGCWSSVGRIGGRQELNLQSPGCLTKKGTVEHEMMHALGFLHEQNRWERDKHVTVNYDNVQDGKHKPDVTSQQDYSVSQSRVVFSPESPTRTCPAIFPPHSPFLPGLTFIFAGDSCS